MASKIHMEKTSRVEAPGCERAALHVCCLMQATRLQPCAVAPVEKGRRSPRSVASGGRYSCQLLQGPIHFSTDVGTAPGGIAGELGAVPPMARRHRGNGGAPAGNLDVSQLGFRI